MCIACQQDFMWLAYLESRGLLGPEKPEAAPGPFAAVPEVSPQRREGEAAPASKFSCDDPADAANDLKRAETGGKSE